MTQVPDVLLDALRLRTEQRYADSEQRSESLSQVGSGPDVRAEPIRRYIVAIRHSEDVTGPFSDFTKTLSRVVPCICYDASIAHTTLATLRPAVETDPVPDWQVIAGICRAFSFIPKSVWESIRIEFGRWLLTPDAVILSGRPISSSFWETAVQLWHLSEQQGIYGLQLPWAAHMTGVRFTAPAGSAEIEQLRGLLLGGPKPSASSPSAIDVGWYECSRAGFRLYSAVTFRP